MGSVQSNPVCPHCGKEIEYLIKGGKENESNI